jgi:hypothetical protein
VQHERGAFVLLAVVAALLLEVLLALGAVTTAAHAQASSVPVAAYTMRVQDTPPEGGYVVANGDVINTLVQGRSLDDQLFTNVPIGFEFTFGGRRYTSMTVSANGWVSFGGTPTPAASATPKKFFYPLDENTNAIPVIAVFATDVTAFADNSLLSYYLSGVAPNRQCVVLWSEVNIGTASRPSSFRLVLSETTGEVLMNFNRLNANKSDAIAQIGLRGVQPTDFHIRAPQTATTNHDLSVRVQQLTARTAFNADIQTDFVFTPPAATATTFSLTGRCVAGGNNAPLGNVLVSAGDRTARTNAQGAFSIDGLPNGVYAVQLDSVFMPSSVVATVAGSNVDVGMFRRRGGGVTGQINFATNSVPPQNVLLTFSSPNGVFTRTVASNNGAYTFTDIGFGSYTVTPTAVGMSFEPASRLLLLDVLGIQMGGFTARRDVSVTGRVVSSLDAAMGVANVVMKLTNSTYSQEFTTDQAGGYVFANVPAGTYTLAATERKNLFRPIEQTITVTNAPLSRTITVPQGWIDVRVRRADGNGVPAATVEVRPTDIRGQTDNNGQVRIAAFPNREQYRIEVIANGLTVSPSVRQVTVTEGQNATAEFTVLAPGQAAMSRVRGRVVGADGSTGIGGVPVVAVDASAARSVSLTDRTGEFRFDALPLNRYSFVIADVNNTAARGDFDLQSPVENLLISRDTTLTLRVRSARITGRVTLSGAATTTVGSASGVAGVTVEYRRSDDPGNDPLFRGFRTSTTTDAQGNYVLAAVPSRLAATVSARLNGYTFTPNSATVPVSETAPAQQQFVVASTTQPIFSISGRVVSSLDATVGMAGVTITGGGRTAVSDAQGNFTLTQLGSGTYALSASRAGWSFAALPSVTISNSDATGVRVTAQLYSVSGVVRVGGVAVANVEVSNGINRVNTDASGRYTFLHLPPGTYTVSPNVSSVVFTPSTIRAVVASMNLVEQNFSGVKTAASSTGGTLTLPTSATLVLGSSLVLPVQVVALVSPANGSTLDVANRTVGGVETPVFPLSWTAVSGATRYEVQLATDSAFTRFLNSPAPLALNPAPTGNEAFIPKAVVFPGKSVGTLQTQALFWRVRAVTPQAMGLWASGRWTARIPMEVFPPPPMLLRSVSTAFTPLQHGWSFASNDATALWPQEYFTSINYPSRYPLYMASSREFAQKAAIPPPNNAPLWDAFALGQSRRGAVTTRLLGSDIPSSAALALWVPRAFSDVAAGMAAVSLLHYAGVYTGNTPFFTPRSNALRTLLHAHQFGTNPAVLLATSGDTPVQTAERVWNALQSADRRQHPILSAVDVVRGGSATLIPYRMVSSLPMMRDSMWVYDPRVPAAASQVLVVDRRLNSWQYGVGGRTISGTNGLVVSNTAANEQPIAFAPRPLARAAVASVGIETPADAQPSPAEFVQIIMPNAARASQADELPTLTVRNAFGSITNGKDPFGEDNTFAAAAPVLGEHGVEGFVLPRLVADNLVTSYTPPASAAVGNTPQALAFLSNERFAARAEWNSSGRTPSASNATPDEQQFVTNLEQSLLQMNSRSALSNLALTLSTTSENPALWQQPAERSGGYSGENSEGHLWENVVRVEMASFPALDTLSSQLINDGGLVRLQRSASAASVASAPLVRYDVTLARAESRTFRGLVLGWQESQMLVVQDWNNLARSGVRLLRDLDSDGKIDSVQVLSEDLTTSVGESSSNRDQALPSAANAPTLHVYPNPSHGDVWAEYSLGKPSLVSVEVVTLLGTPVLALGQTQQHAGRQRVRLPMADVPTGLYLVRVHAGTERYVSSVHIAR